MARFVGKDGVVTVGGTVVLDVTNFTIDDDRSVFRASPMGAGYVAHASGQPAFTGTIECLADPADAGQTALDTESDVALELRPQGTGSGLPQFSWSAVTVSNVNRVNDAEDWARITFNWAANSPVDKTAQA